MYDTRNVVNIVERIERSIERMADGECWLTSYAPSSKGYPRVSHRGKATLISHIMWEAHNAEPIPEGLQVLHHCDNRACVNPDHLYVGTPQDNVNDMKERNRFVTTVLRAHSDEDYLAIFNDPRPTAEIDKAYGISKGHIRRIKRTGSGKQPVN